MINQRFHIGAKAKINALRELPHSPFCVLRSAFCVLLCFLLLSGCYTRQKKQQDGAVDLQQIVEKGELTVVTMYSSTSYFLYRMEPMGYEYDLIKAFADSKGLKLNVKVAENTTRLVDMLQAGDADVVAFPIPLHTKLKEEVLYCGREEVSSQVLVQRRSKNDKLLRDVVELIDKEVYVKHNTKYHERLKNLDVELGGGIHIRDIERDTVTTEDLIEMVSVGTIPYTLSDDRVAQLNKTYFWNIDVSLPVSFPQRSSWVVRKSSPKLAEAIDEWSSNHVSDPVFQAAVKRYFELSKKVLELSMPEIKQGNISPYDSLFKKHAKTIDWNWMLLASVSYQESHFKNSEVSWAGAQGLMGIMPGTARFLNVPMEDLLTPEINIQTGVEVLKRFSKGFANVPDRQEQIKMTLASYNAGIGHIQDAQRLAEKYGKDPNVWDDNVAECIRWKREPEYYNDPVVKHGYLRGTETFNYVREVMGRYEYYKQQLK